jgi:hypothetical protein
VARGKAIAGRIRVGPADQHPADRTEPLQDCFQGGERPRTLAAAGRHIQGVIADLLDRGQAERVDRRLEHREPLEATTRLAELEQRLPAAAERSLKYRAANFDMADLAVPAVSEPGATVAPEPDQILP